MTIDAQRRAELIAARQAIWTAWFANDTETLRSMLPPEFVGIGVRRDGRWVNPAWHLDSGS